MCLTVWKRTCFVLYQISLFHTMGPLRLARCSDSVSAMFNHSWQPTVPEISVPQSFVENIALFITDTVWWQHFRFAVFVFFFSQRLPVSSYLLLHNKTLSVKVLAISRKTYSMFLCCFFVWALVWSGWDIVGKRWCHMLPCTNQEFRVCLLVLRALSIRSDKTIPTNWWRRLAEFWVLNSS